MGIANKCFEVLENKTGWEAHTESRLGQSGQYGPSDPEDDEDMDEDALVDDDDTTNDAAYDEEADDETESDSLDDAESDVGEPPSHARLRLREILFYDDKVAVFRARHGRL